MGYCTTLRWNYRAPFILIHLSKTFQDVFMNSRISVGDSAFWPTPLKDILNNKPLIRGSVAAPPMDSEVAPAAISTNIHPAATNDQLHGGPSSRERLGGLKKYEMRHLEARETEFGCVDWELILSSAFAFIPNLDCSAEFGF
jgi:hypothetical protein